MERPNQLSRKDIQRFFLLLVGFELLLIGAYFLDMLLGSPFWLIQRLVDIDGEASFASWFSSIQLFLIGLMFFLWGWTRPPGPGPDRWFVMLGAVAFFFLSADEALFIHESLTRALIKYDMLYRFKGDHGMWIPFYIGVLVLLVVLCQGQIRLFYKHHQHPFLLIASGAALFLLGAVGLEIAAYEFIPKDSPVLLAEVAAEEFLEMIGASIILYATMGLLLSAPEEKQPDSFLSGASIGDTTSNSMIST